MVTVGADKDKMRKMIERETSLMKRLRHPNIIEYIEDFPSDKG